MTSEETEGARKSGVDLLDGLVDVTTNFFDTGAGRRLYGKTKSYLSKTANALRAHSKNVTQAVGLLQTNEFSSL